MSVAKHEDDTTTTHMPEPTSSWTEYMTSFFWSTPQTQTQTCATLPAADDATAACEKQQQTSKLVCGNAFTYNVSQQQLEDARAKLRETTPRQAPKPSSYSTGTPHVDELRALAKMYRKEQRCLRRQTSSVECAENDDCVAPVDIVIVNSSPPTPPPLPPTPPALATYTAHRLPTPPPRPQWANDTVSHSDSELDCSPPAASSPSRRSRRQHPRRSRSWRAPPSDLLRHAKTD